LAPPLSSSDKQWAVVPEARAVLQQAITRAHTLEAARALQREAELVKERAISAEAAARAAARQDELARLRALYANATLLQCPQCKHGPIEMTGCDNLDYSGTQITVNGVTRNSNSCPDCGFFSRTRAAFHSYSGSFESLLLNAHNNTAADAVLTPAERRRKLIERERGSPAFGQAHAQCARSLDLAHRALELASAALDDATAALARDRLWAPSFAHAADLTAKVQRAWRHLHAAFDTAMAYADAAHWCNPLNYPFAVRLFAHLLRVIRFARALLAPLAPGGASAARAPRSSASSLSSVSAAAGSPSAGLADSSWRTSDSLGLHMLNAKVNDFARLLMRNDRSGAVAAGVADAAPDVAVVRYAEHGTGRDTDADAEAAREQRKLERRLRKKAEQEQFEEDRYRVQLFSGLSRSQTHALALNAPSRAAKGAAAVTVSAEAIRAAEKARAAQNRAAVAARDDDEDFDDVDNDDYDEESKRRHQKRFSSTGRRTTSGPAAAYGPNSAPLRVRSKEGGIHPSCSASAAANSSSSLRSDSGGGAYDGGGSQRVAFANDLQVTAGATGGAGAFGSGANDDYDLDDDDDDDDCDDDGSGLGGRKRRGDGRVAITLSAERAAELAKRTEEQQQQSLSTKFVEMGVINDLTSASEEPEIERVDHATYELIAALPAITAFRRLLVLRARQHLTALSAFLPTAPAGTVPAAFCVVIDCSRSMAGRRGEFARNALVLLLETFRRLECPVSVVRFSGSGSQQLLLRMGSARPLDVERGETILTQLTASGEGTRYTEALEFAATSAFILEQNEREQKQQHDDQNQSDESEHTEVKALMSSVIVISDGDIETVRDNVIAENLARYRRSSPNFRQLALVHIASDSENDGSAASKRANDRSDQQFQRLKQFYLKCTGGEANDASSFVRHVTDSKVSSLPEELAAIVELQIRERTEALRNSNAGASAARSSISVDSNDSSAGNVVSVGSALRRVSEFVADSNGDTVVADLVSDLTTAVLAYPVVAPGSAAVAAAIKMSQGFARGSAGSNGFYCSARHAPARTPLKSNAANTASPTAGAFASDAAAKAALAAYASLWAARRGASATSSRALPAKVESAVKTAWNRVLSHLGAPLRGVSQCSRDNVLAVNRFSVGAPAAKGSKLSMVGLTRFFATGGVNKNIFESQAEGGGRSYSLGILLDRSSSLAGTAGAEAHRAAVLLAETFMTLELPQFAMMAFGDALEVLKRRDEPFTTLHKLRLLAAKDCVAANTNDAAAITSIAHHLAQGASDDTPALLFVLTDGYSSDSDALRRALYAAEAQGVTVVAISLGDPVRSIP